MENKNIEITIKVKEEKFNGYLNRAKPTFWRPEEDKILCEKAKEYNYKNWAKIAKFIKGKSDIQCSARFKRIRPGIVKGIWNKEEDDKLLNLYEKYGANWSNISKEMPQRTGKQIRERYINFLDKKVDKSKFTKEEDEIIIKNYQQFGKCWSKISKLLIGRTADMVKNRFYSSIKYKIFGKDKFKLLNKKRKIKDSLSKTENLKAVNFKITKNSNNIFIINKAIEFCIKGIQYPKNKVILIDDDYFNTLSIDKFYIYLEPKKDTLAEKKRLFSSLVKKDNSIYNNYGLVNPYYYKYKISSRIVNNIYNNDIEIFKKLNNNEKNGNKMDSILKLLCLKGKNKNESDLKE